MQDDPGSCSHATRVGRGFPSAPRFTRHPRVLRHLIVRAWEQGERVRGSIPARTPFTPHAKEGRGIATRRCFRAPLRRRRGPRLCINGGGIKGERGYCARCPVVLFGLSRGKEGKTGSAYLLRAALHSPFTQRRGSANPAERPHTRGAQGGANGGGYAARRRGGMQTMFACPLSLFTPMYRVARMGERERGCRREEEGARHIVYVLFFFVFIYLSMFYYYLFERREQ